MLYLGGCILLPGKISGTTQREQSMDLKKFFSRIKKIIEIPENIFEGITSGTFTGVFNGCTGLTSIPETLFQNITSGNFSSIFANCTGLTNIPENLLTMKF